MGRDDYYSCVSTSLHQFVEVRNEPHRYGNSRATYGITQTEMAFPPLPQPVKAGTRFSDPRGMQGWVDLVIYQGSIPARRRSPIPLLTRLDVEQLRSCDEQRYHSTKPPTSRHHFGNDVCLEVVKWEDYQNCSVLFYVRQLCTMIHWFISHPVCRSVCLSGSWVYCEKRLGGLSCRMWWWWVGLAEGIIR